MAMNRAMLMVFGLAMVLGSFTPANAAYRHCYYRHHHRICH